MKRILKKKESFKYDRIVQYFNDMSVGVELQSDIDDIFNKNPDNSNIKQDSQLYQTSGLNLITMMPWDKFQKDYYAIHQPIDDRDAFPTDNIYKLHFSKYERLKDKSFIIHCKLISNYLGLAIRDYSKTKIEDFAKSLPNAFVGPIITENVIVTHDQKRILFTKRAGHMDFFPSALSTTYEETVNAFLDYFIWKNVKDKEIEGCKPFKNIFIISAIRGLIEEFWPVYIKNKGSKLPQTFQEVIPKIYAEKIKSINFIGFFRNLDSYGMCPVFLIELKKGEESYKDVNSEEITRVFSIPFRKRALIHHYNSTTKKYKIKKGDDYYHPTNRIRILLASHFLRKDFQLNEEWNVSEELALRKREMLITMIISALTLFISVINLYFGLK